MPTEPRQPNDHIVDASVLDYDFHGRIGLRLIDAAAADRSAVIRQLGTLQQRQLRREPDLRVRFVSRLPAPDLQFLDSQRTAFNREDFFLFSQDGRRKACIPFDRLGGRCEIVVESGMRSVPLLMDAIKLIALSKGLLPLHASAFEYRGTGVLVLGWPHSGKTAALLAMLENGAALVADDVVLLDPCTRTMYGIAAPVEVSDWQIRQIPRLLRQVRGSRRMAWRVLAGVSRLQRTASASGVGALLSSHATRKTVTALQRRLRSSLPAEVVSPNVGQCVAEAATVFFATSHESDDIRVRRADSAEMIGRAFHLAQHDRLSIRAHYHAWRAAFPSRRNLLLESIEQTERELIQRALSDLECWFVRHPRPVRFDELHRALEPACRETLEDAVIPAVIT